MTSTTVVCVAAILAAMLVSSSVALPPDFFRAGRGFPLPIHKKSSGGDLDLADMVCGFCGAFSPTLEIECRRNIAEPRKVCAMTLLNELQAFADDKRHADQ